jgi:hypothetical protein
MIVVSGCRWRADVLQCGDRIQGYNYQKRDTREVKRNAIDKIVRRLPTRHYSWEPMVEGTGNSYPKTSTVQQCCW